MIAILNSVNISYIGMCSRFLSIPKTRLEQDVCRIHKKYQINGIDALFGTIDHNISAILADS